MASNDRAEALRRLAELGAPTAAAPAEAPRVKRTGDEVPAGGDVARLLVRPAHLTYREGNELRYAAAQPGDVILVTATQAKRLDDLGATVDPEASEEDVEAATDGEVTDEQLRTMKAADLVAHVAQHPDDRDRVRALELERAEDKRRSTVLDATANGDEDEDLDEE